MKRSGLPLENPLRALGDGLNEVLDAITESWPVHRSSDHLRLEIAAAFDADRKGSLPSVDEMLAQGVADLDEFSEPSVLTPGEPVPGCGCPVCTGIPADHPVRQRQIRRRQAGQDPFVEIVETARAVPLLEVVQRLGLDTPVKKGKELAVCCPLHDDHRPSMSLDTDKGLWFCHPCGEGGDAIQLYMRARRIDFAEAVRELAA